MMKKVLLLICAFALCFSSLQSLAGEKVNIQSLPQVVIHTSLGDILIELDSTKAPATVDNFLQYAKDGFYDGTIFHRVIRGFMIQGGGFTEAFEKKTTRAPIKNEADNGLKNNRGTIAMARTPNPHSATGQFFINLVNNDGLNHRGKTQQGWGYAVFGKVTQGMEVVDNIAKARTTRKGPHQNVPVNDIVIKSVEIVQ